MRFLQRNGVRAQLDLQPLPCRRLRAVGSSEQPITQFALLSSSEAGDVAAGLRALLDRGEGLQHGVVQVRSDLRTFRLLARPARSAIRSRLTRSTHGARASATPASTASAAAITVSALGWRAVTKKVSTPTATSPSAPSTRGS
ncbi:hypothetical protein [Leucobacter soli]|uniref:hypothetical protein n=1 Tax=Leucobacter soli TaxID=2812850 RepID=UPI003607AA68